MYRKRYETLGNAIKYHRVSKSISQGALAATLEITPQYLSKIEHGAAHPSLDLIFAIADALRGACKRAVGAGGLTAARNSVQFITKSVDNNQKHGIIIVRD